MVNQTSIDLLRLRAQAQGEAMQAQRNLVEALDTLAHAERQLEWYRSAWDGQSAPCPKRDGR